MSNENKIEQPHSRSNKSTMLPAGGSDLKGLAERGDGIVVFQVCDRFEALFGGSEEDAERFLNCLWAEGALSVWQ